MAYQSPIVITSGFRCKAHQEDLRQSGLETAVGTSSHERGIAADVTCLHLDTLLQLADPLFPAMGVAKSFVHVDLRKDKRRRWKYGT